MTRQELKERQSWTLKQKIDHSLGAIDQFLSRMNGKAYVCFSGGKDSTVLLHLCRIIKPDIEAVFCNTGNEFPDIVKFVRSTPNCRIIYPKMKPYQIMDKYGFPLISKRISRTIATCRRTPNGKTMQRILDEPDCLYAIPQKYMHLLYTQYNISSMCCNKLKKEPMKAYEKESGKSPIMGVMADESKMRMDTYVNRGGCNVFKDGKSSSLPLSIWVEKDIWDYIEDRNLKISDIYHKGAKRTGCVFCGYGAQFKDDNRFKMLLSMYPKMYNKCMNYTNNGITYREALRNVLSVNGLYLPDEEPRNLFTDIW